MTVLITGGAGFIGSNFVIDWFDNHNEPVVNLDKLTYAGNLNNLTSIAGDSRHIFLKGDIGDDQLIRKLLSKYQPRAVIHFAAESHVDKSIVSPDAFVQTNVLGTFRLLECVKEYWSSLPKNENQRFRFLHVSTDEVFGSLSIDEPAFVETSPYQPNSPYSASKAASDHLVRAYNQTFNLPTITTNCSNNYGPYQFPEKLIPLMITNALAGVDLPVYGDGLQSRDWLYVGDHCAAIRCVLEHGEVGESYNIGGLCEKYNIEVVHKLCDLLSDLCPRKENDAVRSYYHLIKHINDRPGHDRRYAMNVAKIQKELDWTPEETFDSGMKKTIAWYLDNRSWIENIMSGNYQRNFPRGFI